MVLDFSVEAAKLRERADRKKAATISSYKMSSYSSGERTAAEHVAVAAAPFGSGWYHDAAVVEADHARPRKA